MSTSHGRKPRSDGERNRRAALAATKELLADPGATLTIDTIAARADLGRATVVRAFGTKDALLDAAAGDLLEPIVLRSEALSTGDDAESALRTFLTELIAFQVRHNPLLPRVEAAHTPVTAALRDRLAGALRTLVDAAVHQGAIRTDLDPEAVVALISETSHAVSRAQQPSHRLADTYITVLLDGLRGPGR